MIEKDWSLLCATWWPEFRQEYTYHAASAERGMDCTPKFSGVQLFATPWTAELQAFLSFPISQSLLKLKSIESVMPSNHLILCHHLLLLPSVFTSIGVVSNELAVLIRWPKYWSLSLSIGEGNGTPLQYSCLENPMGGGAW